MRIKKTVYTQSSDTAREKGELEKYYESRQLNTDCAKVIGQSITDSNYGRNLYDLESAARKVIDIYGEKRVAWVTANTLQSAQNDLRYSNANKEWANGFDIPQVQRENMCYRIPSHPCLVDGFADGVRKVCSELETAKASARAEKRTAVPIQPKPTLKERLEEGKLKATNQTKANNTKKSKQKEGLE